MDNEPRETFKGADHEIYEYPKLFTLDQFEAKYGEDNCTIMLQDRERQLYMAKQSDLSMQTFAQDEDAHQNMQVALDAWKPCDDRPPTEMEARAQEVLSMSPQAQAVFIRHINAGIAEQAAEKARVDAAFAAGLSQVIEDKFRPPADVGPPVTRPQQETPIPTSFEQLGAEADRANAEVVDAARQVSAAEIQAATEHFAAPTAFEEGGLEGATEEGPAQTEVGMPPPAAG